MRVMLPLLSSMAWTVANNASLGEHEWPVPLQDRQMENPRDQKPGLGIVLEDDDLPFSVNLLVL